MAASGVEPSLPPAAAPSAAGEAAVAVVPSAVRPPASAVAAGVGPAPGSVAGTAGRAVVISSPPGSCAAVVPVGAVLSAVLLPPTLGGPGWVVPAAGCSVPDSETGLLFLTFSAVLLPDMLDTFTKRVDKLPYDVDESPGGVGGDVGTDNAEDDTAAARDAEAVGAAVLSSVGFGEGCGGRQQCFSVQYSSPLTATKGVVCSLHCPVTSKTWPSVGHALKKGRTARHVRVVGRVAVAVAAGVGVDVDAGVIVIVIVAVVAVVVIV